MSKTPRTDELQDLYENYEYRANVGDIWELARELETELADMREMFTEYVKAEDAWRDAVIVYGDEYDNARIRASKLRKQAKEVLGL